MSNENMDLHVYVNVDDYKPKIGEEITWTITVNNSEAGDAKDVNVSDVLPDGLKFVSGYTNDGSYSDSSGNWSIGTIKAGESATMEIKTLVVDANTSITNRVEVSSSTHDCNPSNNAHSMTIHPWMPTEADLAVTKSVSNPNPEVGSVVDWTVSVSNSGPDTAWNTTVVEALPDGLTPVGTVATMGNFQFNDGVWNVGHLQPGETAQMTMSTRIDSDQAASYVSTASATSSTYDANTDNNSASATANSVVADEQTAVVEEPVAAEEPAVMPDAGSSPVACCCSCDNYEEAGADLQVIKLVDNPTPNLNSPVVWSIMVTNNGIEEAINVVLNDNLPAGVEYVSNTATMGEFSLAGGAWDIGDLAPGASALLQLTTVATDAELTQVNIAMVSSDSEDNNPSNDSSQASIDAVAADLSIAKSVDDPAPDLGSNVVWTIDVENLGPDVAENVTVEDLLPEGTVFVSTTDDRFDPLSGKMLLGDLASGDSVSVDIEVKVIDADGARVNTATVTSDTFDPDASNNADDAETDAVAADLVLIKTVNNEEPILGAEVVWTIEVINNGPDTAASVTVSEVLPAGTTFVKSSDDRFDSIDKSIVLGDLESGESISFDVTVTVDDADGAQVNTASVTSETFDNDITNNIDDASTDAIAADLEVTKTVDNPQPLLGDNVIWKIVVKNNGPDTAENVVLKDTLPEGTLFISADDDRFNPEFGALELGDLESGQTFELNIEVEATDADGAKVNNASVSSTTYDNNLDNNEDNAEIDAIGADLSLVKTVNAETANVGDALQWTLAVTNDGPDAATGVVVRDMMPEEVETAGGSKLAFLGDSWMAGNSYVDTVAQPIAEHFGLEFSKFAYSGYTAARMAEDTAWGLDFQEVASDTQVVFASFGANEFNNGDTLESYAAGLNDLFDIVKERAPDSEIVFLMQAEGVSANPVNEWADYVDVAQSATESAGVKFVNLGDNIPPYEDGSAIWADSLHLDESATELVIESLSGYELPVSGDWYVGDLAVGESASMTIDGTVNSAGEFTNFAQIIAADQPDPDSVVNNFDTVPVEDDEASASVVVSDNPKPIAEPDIVSFDIAPEVFNAVLMVDHSGSMGKELTHWDGVTPTTRLEMIQEAVTEFAGRDEVSSVRILGFDAHSSGPGNMSEWFDVSASIPQEMTDFLGDFEASDYTNYGAAVESSQTVENVPENSNYYFLSDGAPRQTPGSAGYDENNPAGNALVTDSQESAWQEYVEANFVNAYAIGFGINPNDVSYLDAVAHTGRVDYDGDALHEENTVLATEIHDIPSELFKTISVAESGNVLQNDDFGGDGPLGNVESVKSLEVDGIVYTFDGTVSASGTPSGRSVVGEDYVSLFTENNGLLEFNFSSGDFTYYSTATTTGATFQYTIADAMGEGGDVSATDVAVGEIVIEIAEPMLAQADEIFVSSEMADINLPQAAEIFAGIESPANSDEELYAAAMLVV